MLFRRSAGFSRNLVSADCTTNMSGYDCDRDRPLGVPLRSAVATNMSRVGRLVNLAFDWRVKGPLDFENVVLIEPMYFDDCPRRVGAGAP